MDQDDAIGANKPLMDLDDAFGTDESLEVEGAWVEIQPGTTIRVARMNNPEYRKLVTKLRTPYRSIIMSGRELPDAVAEKITIQALARTVLKDWQGVSYRKEPLPFTIENALMVLTALKDFRDIVAFLAMQAETFRRQATEAGEGNSVPTSTGA